MPLITITDAQLAFGHLPLLWNTGFSLDEGERLGLIGRNGTGKSSLLKIVAGLEHLDDGRRQIAQNLRLTYLAQEPDLDDNKTVFETVSEGLIEVKALREEFEQLSERIGQYSEDTESLHKKLDEIQSAIESQSGWQWEQRVDETMARLGLASERKIAGLSGGLRKRVALAQALVTAPDVLLLDEPTNHLDLSSIEWLEGLLLDFKGAMLFVTHDRRFLDRLATSILWLDRANLKKYPGNYTTFEELRESELQAETIAVQKSEKLLAQEEVWSRKGVEARRTKSVARLARLQALRQEHASRRHQTGQVQLSLSAGDRSGKLVAELLDVSKSFSNKPVVHNFSTTVLRGDKIGIIGPNGAGKSTLLKLILGEVQPDSGRLRQGTKIQLAYFDQMRTALDLEASLENTISPGSEWIEWNDQRKHVKSYLADFLFPPERAASPVKSLSGGERNRLLLARLFAQPANVLVLDEPTNDLDIETLELLEQLLVEYSGTVFLVSHDRAFLDHVVTSTIAFEGDGNWVEYEGGYDDYLVQKSRRLKALSGHALNPSSSPRAGSEPPKEGTNEQKLEKAKPSKPLARLSNKEREALSKLPAEIEALEQNIDTLQQKLADPNFYKQDPSVMAQCKAELAASEESLERAMSQWEVLLQKEAQQSR
ncbi:MAG: ATP-binding cassette domain-containing protein [Burkholderiaceae bacterium]